MKCQLFIACLVFYSQMTQATAAGNDPPPPTCVRHVKIRTFEIRTISADDAACMKDTHAMSFNDSSLPCSCMASATKNGMNSFRVVKSVCYLYLASPPADDTGTQQIYVARSPAPGSEGAPVCADKCCKDGSTKTAGGLCWVMEKTNQLKWEEARQKCKETPGSRLVEAPTPEIVEELHQYIYDNGDEEHFWVGLKRNLSDVWGWVESGPPSTPIAWDYDYPLSTAGQECGELNYFSPTFFNAGPCDKTHRYICSGLPATRFCPAGK